MAEAKQGDRVKVHYTGKFDDGTVFDSSQGREPLEFTLGAGEIIPGFDQNVAGMAVGETKTFDVTPQSAYGDRDEQLLKEIEKDQLPSDLEVAEGMQLQAKGPDDQPVLLTVAEVKDASVVLDANHPLAGKDLTFDVELVEIA